MLAVAAHRVTEHGWDNVRLIAAPVATAPIDGMADAALFCAVHDIMQSRAALDNIVAHLRPGSPVAATGGKQPALWMWPLRPWVIRLHRPFITDFTGFDRPWRLLAEHVPDLQVRELACTGGYLAVGHIPAVRQMRKPKGSLISHRVADGPGVASRARRSPPPATPGTAPARPGGMPAA